MIQYLAFVAISVDAMVLLCLFRLRRTRPDADRPFLAPGYPVLPAFTVGLYAALFVIITTTQPQLALGGAGLLGALAIAGWLWTRGSR